MTLVGVVGSFTTAIEEAAAAVGAGVLLGSVVMGVVALALGWSRRDLGDRALTDGYVGGFVGGFVAAVEFAVRYLF